MNSLAYRAHLAGIRARSPSPWAVLFAVAMVVLAFGSGVVYGINADQRAQTERTKDAQERLQRDLPAAAPAA